MTEALLHQPDLETNGGEGGSGGPGERDCRLCWGLLLGIFLLAAVPRLAVVWSGVVPLAPDTWSYVIPAKNLAAGRGYVDDAGRPYSFRPPTYPLFLAVVFSVAGVSPRAVEIVQVFLMAGAAGALALWMARRSGPATGAAAGILISLDPLLVPVPAFVLTEALGVLLVIGTVICLERGLFLGRRDLLLLAGLLGGAVALNTLITLLLVPWLLLTAWVFRSPRRPDWRACALAMAMVAACLGAWTLRNYMVRGQAVVIRDVGFGSLVWGTTEYDFDWLPSPHVPAWAEIERKFNAIQAGHTDREGHNRFLREAWRNFRENPLLVLKRVAKANFWFWIEAPGSHIAGELRPVRWITLVFHQLQLLGFAIALWSLSRTGLLRQWALWVATIMYFALFLSLMLPVPRYYVPVLPVMDTLIAVGLTRLAWRAEPSSIPGSDSASPVEASPAARPV